MGSFMISRFVAFFSIALLVPSLSFAGGLAGMKVPSQIKIGEKVFRIAAPSGEYWNDPDNCSGNGTNKTFYLYLEDTTDNFKEIYSAILSSRVSKSPIDFYLSGCHLKNGKNLPKVKVAYF